MDLTDSRLRAMARQDATSVEQNAEFFLRDKHGRDAAELDAYRNIREALTREVAGTNLLLDVGNGGVFEYDTTEVERIVAVDLFLDRIPFGGCLTQFGRRWPAELTPARAVLIVGRKRAADV